MSLNRDLSTTVDAPSPRVGRRSDDVGARPSNPWEAKQYDAVCALSFEGPEPIFDRIAHQAAEICEAPVGLITALRGDDQLFLGRSGIEGTGNSRSDSICAHELFWSETLVVPDAHLNPRFSGLDSVIGAPFVRFYAGAPIHESGGIAIGRVCVTDTCPRVLRPEQADKLRRLADLVSLALDARRMILDQLGPAPSPDERKAALDRLARTLESSLT